MANLTDNDAAWVPGVYQIEDTDPVDGGPPDPNPANGAGIVNLPHKHLADRTAYLLRLIQNLTLDGVLNSATRLAMTVAERAKLGGIAPGATANATDAQLRDRATHTGTQPQSSVAGLVQDLANKGQRSVLDALVADAIRTSNSPRSLGQAGYFQIGTAGLRLMWGRASLSGGVGGATFVDFNPNFPNACVGVWCQDLSVEAQPNSAHIISVIEATISASGFRAYAANRLDDAGGIEVTGIKWLALGY
jgi:hypothetical protein